MSQQLSPPEWVVENFQLPTQSWFPVTHDAGQVAQTWVSAEWVLQSRPSFLMDRMLVLHQLSEDIYLTGLSFVGPLMIETNQELRPAQTGMGGERIWNLQPRLRELRPLYSDKLNDDQLINNSMLVFPEVLSELQYFAGAAAPNTISKLNPTAGIRIQQLSCRKIIILANTACPLTKNPMASIAHTVPSSPRVLSHGDPTLKNTLLTPSGPCLIDWEAVSLLPRHMDLTHMVAYLCKITHPERWDEIMWRHWEKARLLLPSWSGRNWHTACCWYLAREILAFPVDEQEKLELYWKGIQQQVKRVGWKYD